MPFLKCHLYKERRTRTLEKLTLRQGWRSTVINPSNDKYRGEWMDNKKEGYGICVTRSDRLYDGTWGKHYRLQFGTSCFGLGNGAYQIEYRGQWKNGHYHGKGEKHFKDFSYYTGYFKNSKCHGFGQMWYGNGSFYCGYWHKGLRRGQGLFVECNGNRYEGGWIDDLKDGPGRYFILSTGQFLDGVWKNDICVTGTMADIPFRQTVGYPTPYTINEVQIADEENKCFEMIKNALMDVRENLTRAPEITDVRSYVSGSVKF